MFKTVALKQEIQSLKEKLSDCEGRNIKLAEEKEKQKLDYSSKINDLEKKNIEIWSEKSELGRKLEEVKKENEILRKYYDLDKEASDEIKAKIHIDLELNRLKEENFKLTVMANRQPQFMPMTYPRYSPFGRF